MATVLFMGQWWWRLGAAAILRQVAHLLERGQQAGLDGFDGFHSLVVLVVVPPRLLLRRPDLALQRREDLVPVLPRLAALALGFPQLLLHVSDLNLKVLRLLYVRSMGQGDGEARRQWQGRQM